MNTICPFCQKWCTDAESFDDPTARPVDGDYSICIGCGEWGVFEGSAAGGLRKPTDAEYGEIVATPEMTRMRHAWVAMKRAERRQNRRQKRRRK